MTAAGAALWRRSSRAMVGFGAFRAQHVSRRYTVLRVSIVGPVKAQGTYDPLLVPTAKPSTIPPGK